MCFFGSKSSSESGVIVASGTISNTGSTLVIVDRVSIVAMAGETRDLIILLGMLNRKFRNVSQRTRLPQEYEHEALYAPGET